MKQADDASYCKYDRQYGRLKLKSTLNIKKHQTPPMIMLYLHAKAAAAAVFRSARWSKTDSSCSRWSLDNVGNAWLM